MRTVRCLVLMGIVVLSTTGTATAQSAAPGLTAYAQSAGSSEVTRPKSWTRSQWEAAKKRWSQDREKFNACSMQLQEEKMKRRLSALKQVRFIEGCMSRKS